MSFDRDRLPDPVYYFESMGLKLVGRGKWRTTECTFHGGSDSLRINVESGGFVCMAECGAKGGDVLAYHRAETGLDFVDAAKALGAWVDDGKPYKTQKPIPLPPRDALQILSEEAMLVAVATGNLSNGVKLTDDDMERLKTAASRISRIAEVFQ